MTSKHCPDQRFFRCLCSSCRIVCGCLSKYCMVLTCPIRRCPEYVKGEPRYNPGGELIVEETEK